MADKLREAAQQALEALKYMHDEKCDYMRRNNLGDPLREHAARLALPAIEALEAALAQAEPVAWNKSIRDSVDSLLEQAGYQPDSSARHQLAMMNFDDPYRDHWAAIAEAAQKIAASNECGPAEAKALCAALDRLTEATLAEPVQRTPATGAAPCVPSPSFQMNAQGKPVNWADRSEFEYAVDHAKWAFAQQAEPVQPPHPGAWDES
jgi:hypothetical protein